MQSVATITSKRQFTIPVSIFKRAKLREKQKVVVREKNGVIMIESPRGAVERLAGSVRIPKKFQGQNLEYVIEKAKEIHFKKKFSLK